MAFGPEMIRLQEAWINNTMKNALVDRGESCSEGILLDLRCHRRDITLFISWSTKLPGIFKITRSQKKDLITLFPRRSPLGELLNGHLAGAYLLEARQIQRDRIMALEFSKLVSSSVNHRITMIMELMDRSTNICLLQDGIILECHKRLYPDTSDRVLLPGNTYSPPSPMLSQPHAGLSRGMIRVLQGYPNYPSTAAEMEHLLYSQDPLKTEWQAIQKGKDLFPIPKGLAEEYLPTLKDPLELPSGIMEEHLIGEALATKRKKLLSIIDKKVTALQPQLPNPELLERANRIKSVAEFLMSLPQGREGGKLFITNWPGLEENTEVEIPNGTTPVEEAQRLFKEYRRLLRRHRASEERAPVVRGEIATLEEQRALLMGPISGQDLAALEAEIDTKGSKGNTRGKVRIPKGQEAPGVKRLNPSFGTIYVGLSAMGNREITFRIAKPDDIWFHVKDLPGSHVLLRPKDPKSPIAEEVLAVVASLAAWFSPARSESKAWVDYTQRKNLRPLPEKGVAGVRYKVFKSLLVQPKDPGELGL
ncbi:putative RNA-binding protein, snRNP like protein [Thermanaerovibrio velox DSM 12556]|uniref:Putative RNA-binding protein, snRNP like protein n=2 Tax=Thermanaerovibrio TaxID=81461 RepID=H0URM6_9BACT|nr:putative RNA-binding protein, snRNP like protein [Thermanaerovibrio velox DSM 12556]